MAYDELKLDTYGDAGQKFILYVIISDTDTTFNFLPALMFTQLFDMLCYKADNEYGGRLPTPIEFVLDEFRNIGQIPNFQILITTIRSRNMGCMLFLQAQSQLKEIYKEAAETIIGNCDTEIFLGGKEKSTLEDLEKSLGDETIDLFTESNTYAQSESHGVNFNKIGRKLKTVAELKLMERNKCIVQITGLPPFLSDKYDTLSHPRFKFTGDARKEYIFDFQKYRKRKERREKKEPINRIVFHANDMYTVL